MKTTDLLATADTLAAHLGTLPELAGVAVIVNRQKDLDTIIATETSKPDGALVLVEPVSGTFPDGTKADADTRYSISLWSAPILMAATATPASQRFAAIIAACVGWDPDGRKVTTRRMQLEDWQIVPDETFLIYSLTATLREIY